MYGYETIDEQVAVLVGFDPDGKPTIRPFKLKWHDREYIITKVAQYTRSKEGEKIIHSFHVTDGTNYFQLQCESTHLVWKLARLGDNETH